MRFFIIFQMLHFTLLSHNILYTFHCNVSSGIFISVHFMSTGRTDKFLLRNTACGINSSAFVAPLRGEFWIDLPYSDTNFIGLMFYLSL